MNNTEAFEKLNQKIDELNLLPRHNWKNKIMESWSIGEKAATTRLNQFINNELDGYKEG